MQVIKSTEARELALRVSRKGAVPKHVHSQGTDDWGTAELTVAVGKQLDRAPTVDGNSERMENVVCSFKGWASNKSRKNFLYLCHKAGVEVRPLQNLQVSREDYLARCEREGATPNADATGHSGGWDRMELVGTAVVLFFDCYESILCHPSIDTDSHEVAMNARIARNGMGATKAK